MNTRFKIFRFDPKQDQAPHYDTFNIATESNARILDCLNEIRWNLDSSLAYRMSCGHGICGSDGIMINGVPSLACQQIVKNVNRSKEIVVEPLPFFPIIRDLVVDLSTFYQRVNAIHPKQDPRAPTIPRRDKERIQSIIQRETFDDALKCILCACCHASCPVILQEEQQFIGPASLLRGFRYIFDSRTPNVQNRIDHLQQAHGIWSCKTYFKCTEVCPKKIRVTDAILQTKKKILGQPL